MRRSVLAGIFGALAIGCVAGPFAVVGQRHAPKDPPPAPVTHTTPPVTVAAVETATASATPPPAPAAPVPHTFRVADLGSDSRVTIAGGTIGKHGFLGAIVAAGLSPKEAHRVLVGFSGVRNLDRAAATDAFSFAKAQDGHVVAFELVPAGAMDGDHFDFFQEHETTENERLVATHVSLPIERKRVKVGIGVGDALRASIASAALHEEAATLLDDALDGHAELSDLRAGTRLRIVATEERIEGAFVGYAPIDAVEYTPVGKPAIRVYWYAKGSATDPHHHAHGGYYDTQGRQPYHGAWRSPVPMARISSRFNPNRMHPVLHVVMPHNGIDFAAPPGTPVYAASSGTIRSVGDSGPCGNMVQIEHGGGLISAYCHLSRFASISVGEHVETRQLIGYVGQTGRATGPHLHFAVKRQSASGIEQFIDPMTMKLDGVRIVPPRLRGDFDDLRKTLDAEIDGIALPEATPAQNAPAQDQSSSEETE